MKSSLLKMVLVAVALVAVAAQFAQAVEILVTSEASSKHNVQRWDYDAGPTIAGTAPLAEFVAPLSGAFYPRGMGIGPDHKLYVAGAQTIGATGGVVKRYALDGTFLGDAISIPEWIRGMAIDPSNGDLIISRHGNSVQRYTKDGVYVSEMPDVVLNNAMTFGSDGFLYVARTSSMKRYTAAGVLVNEFSNPIGGNDFTDVLAGPGGIMYVVDAFNKNGIFRFNTNTNTWLDGGAAFGDTGSGVKYSGIALTPDGQLIVSRSAEGTNNAWLERVDINTGTRLFPTEGYWYQATLGGSADGKIVITPEPASLALLGLGCLMMVRRRR